jgi:hypothetical protein
VNTITATEQQVRIAARLYESRDAAKLMLGERYRERMAEYGEVLKAICKRDSVDEIGALNKALRLVDNPYTQIQLMAAAVELVEPSA